MGSVIRRGLGRARRLLRAGRGASEVPRPAAPDVASQLALQATWRALAASGAAALPSLSDVGFQVYSQTDEDGILLYLFAVLGTTNRRAVELCAGDGRECNTANLIIHHGWDALLVDGDPALVERGRRLYATHPATRIAPPAFRHAWLTRDGVDAVVADAGFAGPVDLLSIDVDGIDYWLWEGLSVLEPRVVVVEYQDILGPERAVTVPYRDDFDAYAHPTTDGMPNYCGASLRAFTKLAARRGYRLVGCNRYGYNAFFVREPEGRELIPAVSVESCFRHRRVAWGMRERYPTVAELPWVAV